jgi:hypothetical protein
LIRLQAARASLRAATAASCRIAPNRTCHCHGITFNMLLGVVTASPHPYSLEVAQGSELSVSHDNTPSIGCVRCKSDPAPIRARHPAAPCTFESLTVLTVTDSEKVRPSRQSSAPCLGGKPPRCQLLVSPCCQPEQPAPRPQTPKCGFAASVSLAHRNAISLPCCSIRHAGALVLQPPAAPPP